MEHAEIIKVLREDRGLTQHQLSKGIAPRSSLATFEQGGKKIYWDILYQYLDRMNVTLEEYAYLLNEEQVSEKKDMALTFSNSFKTEFSDEYGKTLLKKYESTKDFYYYGLYAQYYLIWDFRGQDLPKEKITAITNRLKKYLDNIYPWGRFELLLFMNCLFQFSDEFIRFHLEETITRMRIYQDSANYSHDILLFLINGANLSYRRKAYDNLDLFLKELAKLSNISLEAKLVHQIFSLLLEADQGNKDTEQKKKLIDCLTFLEQDDWIEYVEKYF